MLENIWRQGGIKGIMAKIAFCDDDVSVLAEMQRLMEQYCAERDCKIEYNIFNHYFFPFSSRQTVSTCSAFVHGNISTGVACFV